MVITGAKMSMQYSMSVLGIFKKIYVQGIQLEETIISFIKHSYFSSFFRHVVLGS